MLAHAFARLVNHAPCPVADAIQTWQGFEWLMSLTIFWLCPNPCIILRESLFTKMILIYLFAYFYEYIFTHLLHIELPKTISEYNWISKATYANIFFLVTSLQRLSSQLLWSRPWLTMHPRSRPTSPEAAIDPVIDPWPRVDGFRVSIAEFLPTPWPFRVLKI